MQQYKKLNPENKADLGERCATFYSNVVVCDVQRLQRRVHRNSLRAQRRERTVIITRTRLLQSLTDTLAGMYEVGIGIKFQI